jgi:glycosyltransferase involved in cell wall biosynthesis
MMPMRLDLHDDLPPTLAPGANPRPPLKIAVLAHIKHPIRQPFAGGLEAFTFDVVKGLQQRGHDVVLFASERSDPALNTFAICADDNYDADNGSRTWPDPSAEFLSEHNSYLKMMQQVDSQGFDIIFNNSLHYVPVTMASIVRTPMLTVLHTPPIFELSNAYGALLQPIRCATPSKANADSWHALVPECEVIPNGIDLSFWSPKGKPGDHAIWFGRVVPEKGAHLAIQAARRAGVELRLAGPAVNREYFDEQIAPSLGDGVTYLGHLSREELVAEIAGASVAMITPRWDEPFGLVVAEALACGTPVAGFRRGALPELITDETGALAPADDVDGLVEALLRARTKSRAACRARAEAKWGYDQMLGNYEALLRQVAMTRHA